MPTPPDRWTSAPICAHDPDGRPGVDHRARSDPGSHVDEARHEDDSFGEERPVPRDARRNDADPTLGIVGLDGDLVEEVQAPNFHRLDLAQAEVEEDRLLDPLVDDPGIVSLLRHANVASVQAREGVLDGLGVEGAAGPQVIDPLGELHQRPSSPISCITKRSRVS